MDLPGSSMTNRAQIHEIFIFQATVLIFGDLLGGWNLATNAKLQLNICKIMPANP